ncbi:MAG: hypothetical protein OXH52_09985 [Gammaproteobacteria bacterium]|nr:hypothetical protein [Gammaproteobacteria bacterium]
MRKPPAVTIVAGLVLVTLATATRAQDEAISAGGLLVEHLVLNETLTATRSLPAYEQPRRLWWMPIFWEARTAERPFRQGEEVTVVSVGETSLFHDRVVWLRVTRTTDANELEDAWVQVGQDEQASRELWDAWIRSGSATDDRNEEAGETLVTIDNDPPQ